MNIKSFYKIYYDHRIKKASLYRKIYIILIFPINYIINKLFYPSKINLDKFHKKNKFLFEKDLGFLFQYFNSDKGPKLFNQYNKPIHKDKHLSEGHSYHVYYEKFFSTKKSLDINLLELGSFKGNATASLFFYFENSKIYSADLYPDLFSYKSKRIKNFKIDNSSEYDLKKFSKNTKYDIIIEDAGHYLKDQIISLFKLFPTLKKNGLFIIEELDFPDTRRDMNENMEKNTLYNILNLIIKKKDFKSRFISEKEKKFFLKNLKKIDILKGRFNKIAFVRKR